MNEHDSENKLTNKNTSDVLPNIAQKSPRKLFKLQMILILFLPAKVISLRWSTATPKMQYKLLLALFRYTNSGANFLWHATSHCDVWGGVEVALESSSMGV